MYKIRKKSLTLIEIMIVMFLIMMILGVVAYNYRGALDEGKAFKTKADIENIQNILDFALADNPGLMDDIQTHWVDIIRSSPLVKNPSAMVKDGWGEEYQVSVEEGKIVVSSRKYDEYKRSHGTMFKN
jgi:type II secretory pathway pseudopilin PulG